MTSTLQDGGEIFYELPDCQVPHPTVEGAEISRWAVETANPWAHPPSAIALSELYW